MINTWFTSDHHFHHKNIIKYCNRPFDSYLDMHEALISNYNQVVRSNDLVYILGDFAFGSEIDVRLVFERLNGRKHIIVGNHDRGIDSLLRIGFQSAVSSLAIDINEHQVKLSHYPYRRTEDQKFALRHPLDDGGWIFHGHVHEKWKYNNRQINVGVDQWNYFPVHLDELVETMFVIEESEDKFYSDYEKDSAGNYIRR